ncbi:MAG: hypothetical protein WDW36_008594 [Sanguina aurantia]
MPAHSLIVRRTGLAVAMLAASYGPAAMATTTDDVPAAAAPDTTTAKTLGSVSVIGQGETRQVQRITVEDVKILPPGTSPLKVLASKPGVHFESADPFGNYEWSTRICLRGFNQNRLGFTLDGIPLGDMSYGNQNGLHISRALIAENLGGAGGSARAACRRWTGRRLVARRGTASTSDLGGTIQFSRRIRTDATEKPGITVERGHAARPSGPAPRSSFSSTVSACDVDKWKGDGQQEQKQFNAKAVYDWGDNHVGALLTTSSRDETDYQDLSLQLQKNLGWNWDNTRPDWQRALNAAKGIYTGGVTTVDDAYYDARGLRDDTVASVFGDFAVADGVRLKTTAYYRGRRSRPARSALQATVGGQW